MRFGVRNLVTWWQKTRLAAVVLCGVGITMALVISILITTLNGTTGINLVSRLAFSMFPLLAVVLIAVLARIQQRFNLRTTGLYTSLGKSTDDAA